MGLLSTCLMKGMDEREDFIVFCLIQSRLSGSRPLCSACFCFCFDDLRLFYLFLLSLCLFVEAWDRAEVRISLFRVIFEFMKCFMQQL